MNRFENIAFSDLEIVELIAETHQASTKIYLCRYQQQYIVCKAISKQSLKNDAKGVEHVYNQKSILSYFTSRNDKSRICKILGTFQDQQNIYLILEMIQGLPLHKLIQMMGKLKIQFVQLITAQIGLIMEDFHAEGYIYRDIKSSNFMINPRGFVTMIDLGKAKKINKQRTFTICGTAHAMPPDIKMKKGYSYQFDYYSFGVLIYELIVGSSPFGYGNSNKNIAIDIQNGLSPEIMSKVNDQKAKDIISKLMKSNPAQRIGNQKGFSEILKHDFFENSYARARNIWAGQEQLSEYDENFYQQVSEISDFGINTEKYAEISEDDPFYKFL